MKIGIAVLAIASAAVLAFSARPAKGAGDGTVTATVTVASPCIQLDNATADFGVVGLSTNSSLSSVVSKLQPANSYTTHVINCGGGQEAVAIRGTNATATGSSWTLNSAAAGVGTNPCQTGANLFNAFADMPDMGPPWGVYVTQVTPADKNLPFQFAGAGAGQTHALLYRLSMPCAGSSGAGQVMTLSFILTANFAAA